MAQEAEQKELEYHKAAYVEYLNGSFLFDSMYAEDPEASKLAYLPGVPELLETYPVWFGTELTAHLENSTSARFLA
uniref:Dynein regulatory complex subunit 3 n=1 Tax=Sphaerodactylus townsendi TaxID=933632 RepID=A0ACB8FKR2_9SAUR